MAENRNDEKDSQYEALHNSNFKQQKLSAWRPVPTIASTTITFIAFGIVFITIGVVVLIFSNQIVEVEIDYTNCTQNPVTKNGVVVQQCTQEITIDKDMEQPIMVYYQLDNFYQNHRRYVKSKSNDQLAGKNLPVDELLSDCEPIVKNKDLPEGTLSLSKKTLDPEGPAYPCGLIAKSFFNDRYTLKPQGASSTPIAINEKNIAWESDKDLKYKRPSVENWQDIMWLDTEDEHFMVWMRPAGLPNFRKLWGRIETNLKAGKYEVQIENNFNVNFGGKKYFVLSTVNAFGGKNSFLGISYIVVGGICLIMAILFFFGYRSHSKVA